VRRAGRRLALGLLPLAFGSCTSARSATAPAPAVASPAASPMTATTGGGFGLVGALVQGGLVRGRAPAGTVALRLDGVPVAFAADGRFIIGFGRDAAPTARIEATLADGTTAAQEIAVEPRAWNIQSLPTLPKGTTPTPEFLARRKDELAQIAAARAIASASEGWRQSFVWPVTGRISGVFGSQRIYAGEPGEPHSGVDVARPVGTPVAAPADGVVILAAASPFTLEGNLLMIDHGMGLNSAFLHLSRIDVRVGDSVRQGQPIGAIGMTGRATGPHLHWAMKWRDVRIDPAMLARAMP
jgi:murein DD-endopeptidase MepM/ murein hydrolase activator NlpD